MFDHAKMIPSHSVSVTIADEVVFSGNMVLVYDLYEKKLIKK